MITGIQLTLSVPNPPTIFVTGRDILGLSFPVIQMSGGGSNPNILTGINSSISGINNELLNINSGLSGIRSDIALTGSGLFDSVNSLSGSINNDLDFLNQQFLSGLSGVSFNLLANIQSTGEDLLALVFGLSGQNSNFATIDNLTLSGQNLANLINNVSSYLSGNIGITGDRLYYLLNNLSGQLVFDLATKSNLALTGQQNYLSTTNNSLNLSGDIANTGSRLYNIVVGLSGQNNIDYSSKSALTSTGISLISLINDRDLAVSGSLQTTLLTLLSGASGFNSANYSINSNVFNTGLAAIQYSNSISGVLSDRITNISIGIVNSGDLNSINSRLVQTGIDLLANIAATGLANWNYSLLMSGEHQILKQSISDVSGIANDSFATKIELLNSIDSVSALATGAAGLNGEIQINRNGITSTDSHLLFDDVYKTLVIGSPVILPSNPLAIADGIDAPLQINIQNKSSFPNASTDYVATSNDGTNDNNYVNFGINSSAYDDPDYSITEAGDGYLSSSDSNLAIGTAGIGKEIRFHTDGSTIDELRATISSSGINLPSDHIFSINGENIAQQDFDRHSAGLLIGGDMSHSSPTEIDIHQGIGWVWDGFAFKKISWSNFSNQSGFTDGLNYISIFQDGTLNISNIEQESNEYINLGKVYKDNFSGEITMIWNTPSLIGNYQSKVNKFLIDVFGAIVASGFTVREQNSPNFLKLDISEGRLYAKLSEFNISPSTVFSKLFWCSDFSLSKDTVNNDNTINTTLWNNPSNNRSSALVSMTNNYWAKAMIIMNTAGEVHYIYPQAEFATEDLAKNSPLPLSEIDNIKSCAFLAVIVFQKGDTTVANRIYDIRPKMSRAFGSEVSTAGGTVIDHGSLIGLGDDDHCFSEDTELLTDRGFITYENIKSDEKALTFNLNTEELEYQQIKGKYVYNTFREMVSIKNRSGEILVTKGHRIIFKNTTDSFKKTPSRKWFECTAEETLNKSVLTIPTSGFAKGKQIGLSNRYCELLGIIIAEGGFKNPKTEGYGICIYQLPGEQSNYIKDLLDELKIPYTKKTGKIDIYYIRSNYARYNIRNIISEKNISELLMQLRGEQFRWFLSGLMLGDGSVRKSIKGGTNKLLALINLREGFNNNYSYTYHSGDKSLIDSLSHLCTLNGLTTHSYYRKGGFSTGCWSVTIRNRQTSLFSKGQKNIVPYTGNVWCVSVPNTTLVLRRKGFIFIAGNTQYLTSGRADTWFSGKTLDDITVGVTGQQFSLDEKNKLATISGGANVNVQANWLSTNGDSLILNKPFIPTGLNDLYSDSTHRTITDTERTNWNNAGGVPATTVVSQITANMSPNVGVSTEYARADHTHGTPPAGGAGGLTRSQVISTIISFS